MRMGASVGDHLAEYKDIPVYHVSGRYDSWAAQVANLSYLELSKTKTSLQRLSMGPWAHGGQDQSFAGEAEFGPAATIDIAAFQRRWFDRRLKGIDNGVDREPRVRIFVMGGGDGHRTPAPGHGPSGGPLVPSVTAGGAAAPDGVLSRRRAGFLLGLGLNQGRDGSGERPHPGAAWKS